ncbi:na+/H+ antiporter family protein, partial [Vibrio parahaemolyticus AQ3810]
RTNASYAKCGFGRCSIR